MQWHRLKDMVFAIKFLRSLPGRPLSADPLLVQLRAVKKPNITTKATAEQQKKKNTNKTKINNDDDDSSSSSDDDDDDSSVITLPQRRSRPKSSSSKKNNKSTTNNKNTTKKSSQEKKIVNNNNNKKKNVSNKNEDTSSSDDDDDSSDEVEEVGKSNWNGWGIQTFRQVGPELEAECGLQKLTLEKKKCCGTDVCFIHTNPKKPTVWFGTVLSMADAQVTLDDDGKTKVKYFRYQVCPDDIKDPKTGKVLYSQDLIWVDAVFAVPKNKAETRRKVEEFYEKSDVNLEAEKRKLLDD